MNWAKVAFCWIPSKKIRHYLRTCVESLDVKSEWKTWKRLLKITPDEKTILVVEANTTHGEVVPGYVKYCLDLGYKVDVVITPEVARERPFLRFEHENLRIFILSHWGLKLLFAMPKVYNYKKILITSSAYYFLGDGNKWPAVVDVFGLKQHENKLIVVEHDLLDIKKLNEEDLLKDNKILTLSEFDKGIMVNPHYFGEVKVTAKNELTNFIVVGGIQAQRKNHKMLLEAVKELAEKKIENFKITIVGKGNLDDIPYNIRKFFEIKGRLDFPKMYDEMEKADFFLTLLDAENEMHRRYISSGTTGSKQLILGFGKPAIINSEFGKFYGFDDESAIIQKSNNLSNAMTKAINLNAKDYDSMQNNLLILKEDIYKKSLDNMRRIINE